MAMLKKGTTVRLIQPVIQGTVDRADTNGEYFGYVVVYKSADGEVHERFFSQDELEVIPDQDVVVAGGAV